MENLSQSRHEAIDDGASFIGEGDQLRTAIVWVGSPLDQSGGLGAIDAAGDIAGVEVKLAAELDTSKTLLRAERQSQQQVDRGRVTRGCGDRVPLDGTRNGQMSCQQRSRGAKGLRFERSGMHLLTMLAEATIVKATIHVKRGDMTLPAGLVVEPGSGESLPGLEVRNTIKVPHAATGGAFAAFEETTQPGLGPPVHVHTDQWEYFRVLDGEFEFLIGEMRYRAGVGSVAVVPPNTRHGFRNVADSDSTLEFIVTPGGEIDEYFRRLTRLLEAGETDQEALDALGAEYGSINVAAPLSD